MDDYLRDIGLHIRTCEECGGEGACQFGLAITASAAHRLNMAVEKVHVAAIHHYMARTGG